STGEVMGVAENYPAALYKAALAAGYALPDSGTALITVADKDKQDALPLVKNLVRLGFEICATQGTAKMLEAEGVKVRVARKLDESSPNIIDLIRTNQIHLVINTLTKGKAPERDGFRIRRAAVEMGVPCLTSLDTAEVVIEVLDAKVAGEEAPIIPLQEYV
ncbi:MAG: carbamoyl-phosphate synthase large subunit, partial [Bacillota bacterium]|nr:carbamoyl-phosphate synthase large subunit [Bacillota bacterium]